jgi:5-hydroxyisourate hydrolase
MGRLTTHVLDTAHGRPGAGMAIALFIVEGNSRLPLKAAVTNVDGRCDAPLLDGDSLSVGTYELVFDVGAYFSSLGIDLPQPSFLNTVVLRFGVADTAADYHVPLLISPWGYTTYRGS